MSKVMFDQSKNTIRDFLIRRNWHWTNVTYISLFTYSIIEFRIDLPHLFTWSSLPVTINLFVSIINTLQSRNLITSFSNCLKIGEYVMITNLPWTCMLGTSIMRPSIWLDAEVQFEIQWLYIHTISVLNGEQ